MHLPLPVVHRRHRSESCAGSHKIAAGYSRQQFYEIRRNFQTYGADGLREEGGAWPPPPPTAPGKPGTAAVVPVFELRILQSAAMHRTLQFPSCLVIGVKVNFVGAARSLCETMWSPIPI